MDSFCHFFAICLIFVSANAMGGMTGGWRNVEDLDSPEIQKLGKKVTELLSESMNSPYWFKLINITEVKSQVVAGMNYNITFEMGPTECNKSENYSVEIDNCSLVKCGKPRYCRATLWSKPWEKFYKVTYHDCKEGESVCLGDN